MAATGLLVIFGVGGCTPEVGAPEPLGTSVSAPPDPVETAVPATLVSATPANPDPENTPTATVVSPRPAARAAASALPSVSATPKRAAAATTPTPQTLAEVVAVGLAKDNRIALIDPATGKLVRMLDLARPAGNMALAPDGSSAWVFGARAGQSSLANIDVLTGAKHEDVQFHQGDSPEAVTFSSDGTRAFVAMGSDPSSPPGPSTIAFVSASGRESGRITVGRQTRGVQIRRHLSSLAISPGPNGDVLYAAGQASGVVWALDAGSGAVLSEIEVGGGPTSIAVDPGRARAYVLVDTLNEVVVIDTTTLTVTNRLPLPSRAIAQTIGPDGTVFITGGDPSGELWVVEPNATDIRSRVPIGGQPVGLAISSDGKSLYVPDAATSALAVVSADTIQVTRSIPLPSAPLSVVDAGGTRSGTQLTTSGTPAGGGTPAPAPTLISAPTPLPEGAPQPDHLPAQASAEPFVSGAELPVALAFAPDGRLFYNELRTGKIRVVQNGALLPDPFYQFLVADQPASGLIGLTLDPDFPDNHYVYAFFTSVSVDRKSGPGTSGPNEVVRLTDVNSKGTELTPVLRDLPSGDIHTAGTLRFGPDGKLYVSLGDNDKGTYAQDLNTLPGKILRINRDGSIPDDNPFVGDPSKQGLIWAYGLHNASSFAFHPVGNQLLAVENGRAGSDALDLIVRGANYGWAAGGVVKAGVNDPLAVINPPIGPTGSTFYTGDQMPEWTNDWFYCNADQGQLRRVRLAPDSFDRIAFEEVVKQGCAYDVVTGPDGALYYSDAKGIYRIRRSGADVLPAVKMGLAPQPTATDRP